MNRAGAGHVLPKAASRHELSLSQSPCARILKTKLRAQKPCFLSTAQVFHWSEARNLQCFFFWKTCSYLHPSVFTEAHIPAPWTGRNRGTTTWPTTRGLWCGAYASDGLRSKGRVGSSFRTRQRLVGPPLMAQGQDEGSQQQPSKSTLDRQGDIATNCCRATRLSVQQD